MSVEKKARQRGYAVPVLEDQSSDFNGWYSRLKLKLDAKGLWEDFCTKREDVPSQDKQPDEYKVHMKRRKDARWKIDKTLSPDLSKTVEDESTPFGVLERLRKMFVGATKLSLVHQLRAVMEMKYGKGKNLLVFIEELKQGFTKLENMGLPLQDSLKPYILVMVLNDKFENILRPYLVHSLAESTELEFDKLVELLESSHLEIERQEQLQAQDSDAKHQSESALVSKGKNRGSDKSQSTKDKEEKKCLHCHMRGHYIRDCRIYREKQDHGWRHPLPCRSRRDFHDDDRDPPRRQDRDRERDRDRKRDGDRKRSRDGKDNDGRYSRSDSRKYRKRDNGEKAMMSRDDSSRSSSESAIMAIDARCYGMKTKSNDWILDSAATRHMTYSKESLVNYCPISAAVEVGGKHELQVMGIGDKRVTVDTNQGKKTLWLRNVYYVPTIQFNLFSVRMQVAMRGTDHLAVHFDNPV